MSTPLLRLIKNVSKPRTRSAQPQAPNSYNLQISCHVKPNASSKREGITAIREEVIDVAVAAVPKDGEANLAVERLFAQVFPFSPFFSCLISDWIDWFSYNEQLLRVPKSSVGVIRGLKSREKILSITDLDIGEKGEDEFLRGVRQRLEEAVVES